MSSILKEVHRKAIVSTLAANDGVERVVFCGSRAMGTNTVHSDVNIALLGDQLTRTDHARLAVQIDQLPMAQTVDIELHESFQNPSLLENSRQHGVEWHSERKEKS
ncbi:MAG: nucleotidyltransferase domain-containing protein [Gammaproteobacteria bacterium]|nr:nucleotidyltransferase domain-containing protein [Gammaproteobacteria bacterium]